jgi:hypothetical protein
MKADEKINPFDMARRQVDIANKYLNLGPGLLEKLMKIPMRTAALVLGIGRVAEAMRLRGIYP